MTPYDQIGPDALRAVLTDFYDRVFADPMIGFFFFGKDKARLVELEWQLTARVLGAATRYEGRGMGAAHRAHPIMRGHFQRRNRLLEETLADHAVPAAVVEVWMTHARQAERAIIGARALRPRDEHCDATEQTAPSGLRIYNGDA